jgi:hypothetical protein
MKFDHLILDGEIDINILTIINKYIGENVKTLEYKSSNGLSFVFISKDIDTVFQYYLNKNTCNKIKNIFYHIIGMTTQINKKIYFKKNIYNLNFNLLDYLSNFIGQKEDNIIIWEKIDCLNSFPKDILSNIILNNITKILWDISKCLYGLHFNLILHGDPRVDNIGIRNGNFVLFDFDNSSMDSSISSYRKDNWDFLKSLEFNVGKKHFENIKSNHPYIIDTDFMINDMIEHMCITSSKNIDTIFNELNSLQIKY